MAGQVFNTEISGKINEVTGYLRDNTMSRLRAGAEAAVECAKKTGSTKFIQEAEAHLETADKLIKVFSSLCDCCDRYAEQNAKLDNALGN